MTSIFRMEIETMIGFNCTNTPQMASLNCICCALHLSDTFVVPICCVTFFLWKIRADTWSELWSRKKSRFLANSLNALKLPLMLCSSKGARAGSGLVTARGWSPRTMVCRVRSRLPSAAQGEQRKRCSKQTLLLVTPSAKFAQKF